MGAEAGFEPVARRGQPELLEERGRELGVVKVPGVDDDLVDSPGPEGGRERGGLHEVRPVADDRKDSQAAGESSRTP